MVTNRGTVPRSTSTVGDRSALLKALRDSRIEVSQPQAAPTKVTHTGRTTTRNKILDTIGLGDYAQTEGFDPYAGRYGSAGIAPSLNTSLYTRELVRQPVDTPWYLDAWDSTPGPIQAALSHTGGAFMRTLEGLAIPLSLTAAAAEATLLGVWGAIDYDSMPETAKLALDEAANSVSDPNVLKSLGGYAQYLWNRKESGSHDFMYGTGDIFNTFGFLQGERGDGWQSEFEWYGNRMLALAGDITIDPIAKMATFGKLAIPISRGITSGGNAIKLLRTYAARNIDDLPEILRARAVGDDVIKEAINGRLTGKYRESFLVHLLDDLDPNKLTSKVVTREKGEVFIDFGKKFMDLPGVNPGVLTDALKIRLPASAVDDIQKLMGIAKTGATKGRLSMTNEQYKFVAKALKKSDMNEFFLTAAEHAKQGLKAPWKALTDDAVEKAGLRIGIMMPMTGMAARKLITNPIRKRLLGLDALTDPVPLQMLTFSASNKFLGRPTAGAANAMRKVFVGKGDRWRSAGGRMAEQRRIIRKSESAMDVVAAKSVVGAVGRGAAVGRVTDRQFSLMFKEVRDAVKTIPRLAPDHPDGGAVLMRATRGDEAAMDIVREHAGDEIAEAVFGLFSSLRTEAHRRAKRPFLGFVENYGPRQITKEAREALEKRMPGARSKRRHKKPFDASGAEDARKYIDTEEFETLVRAAQKDKGWSATEAREFVSKTKSDEILGQKLFKVNSIMDDGAKAPPIEDQIAQIMDDIGIGYGLFVDNWYEVVPNYMGGLAKRVGEVWTEDALIGTGVFVDRMATMKSVPPRKVQKQWIRVMRAQVKLKRTAGLLQKSLNDIANAEEYQIDLLREQASRRMAALDQAEDEYKRLVKEFDAEGLRVQEADAKVTAIRKEVDDAELRITAIENELKLGDLKNAVKLENERVKLIERLATLKADKSVPRHHLETLRAATVGQLEMEHHIHKVFQNVETFDVFERLFRRWEPNTPVTKETLYAFIKKNKDVEGFAGNLDIIPDTKQFVLRVGKEGAENEYSNDKVLEMLVGANRMLDAVDDTPLGTWLAIELSPVLEAGTMSGLRLQQYSQAYRKIKEEAKFSAGILQEWVSFHPAVWQGNIPTAENVEKARDALVKFTARAQKMGQTYGDALAEIGTDSTLRQHLNTYYGVHDDLNMMNMTSFGTMDTVVAQMETSIRLRKHEIEQALSQFKPVVFHVEIAAGEHGRRLLTLEDYAKYQRIKEAAAQTPYAKQLPFTNAQYSIDDILSKGKMLAEAGTPNAEGVIGGSNQGGKYVVDSPTGPRTFYVKRYEHHAAAIGNPNELADHGRRRVQGEVLANALYREIGGEVGWAPVSHAAQSENGSWWVVSEWLDDVLTVGAPNGRMQPLIEISQDMRLHMRGGGLPKLITAEEAAALSVDAVNIRPVYDMMGDNYLTDVLLANHDVVGMNIENIGITQSGRLARIDNGAVFNFRAQGLPKNQDRPWDFRVVSELESLRNPVVANEYAPMIRKWEEGLESGITAELIKQWQKLDEIRKSYQGWQGFVRKYLPKAGKEADEFVQFLEQRHKYLADKLNQEYSDGVDLMAEALASRGIEAPEISRALTGTHGRNQVTSKARGYDPWLSPMNAEGIPESQALDTFNFETARERVGNPRGNKAKERDLEVLDQVESWVTGGWGQGKKFKDSQEAAYEQLERNRPPTPDDMFDMELSMYEFNRRNLIDSNDVVVDNYTNIYGDVLKPEVASPAMWEEGADVSYGIVLLDDNGEFIMRMPTDGANGKPYGGVEWTFPKGKAGRRETPADAALRETFEETGLEAHILDYLPEAFAGTTGNTYYYIGKLKAPAHGARDSLVTSTKSLADTATVAPVTSDAEVWSSFMTLFHQGKKSMFVDPTGVNVGGIGVAWPDAWGLNMAPPATRNSAVKDSHHLYAVDVNVGIGGERVRTYGIPSHLTADTIAAARAQSLHASQGELEDSLRTFTRKLIGPNPQKPYYDAVSSGGAAQTAGADMSMDMFARIHRGDPQLYEDLVAYFRIADDVRGHGGVSDETLRMPIEANFVEQLEVLKEFDKFGIAALDAMDYQTKVLFAAHLEYNQMGIDLIDDSSVTSFLSQIDEAMNPVDAWSHKVALMNDPDLLPVRLNSARQHLASQAYGKQFMQEDVLIGLGKQPSLGRGETLMEPRIRQGQIVGYDSVPAKGPGSADAAIRYERFMDVYRRSMIGDGYTTAAWINPEQYKLGIGAGNAGRTIRAESDQAGLFNAILIDPFAVGVTSTSIKGADAGLDDVVGLSRMGSAGAKPGLLDVEDFLANYQRLSEDALLMGPRRVLDSGDPVETLFQQRVQAAYDLDGPGGAREQLDAAVTRLQTARQVKEDARLVAAEAKSQTRLGKAAKQRKSTKPPTREEITQRAYQIISAEYTTTGPTTGRPAGRPDMRTESARARFADTDRELRAQAKAELIAGSSGALQVSKLNELNTLISQAEKRLAAANTANAILHKLGTVDKFGRSVPLEKLSPEVRNLKVSVGALMEADARQMDMALKELYAGGEASKWLRQIGEYGDDEIFFPLKRGFREERILDFAFDSGFKPFGVLSQGPKEMVESMTAVTRFRGGGGGMGRFLRHYDKIHNLVKGYMIMKPGFHMRNYFSAVFMNYLAGVQTSSYREFQTAYWNYQHDRAVEMGLTARAGKMKKALKSRLIFGEASDEHLRILRYMDDEGILGGAQGQIGVEQVMAGGPKANTKLKRALQAMNPFSSRNAPLRISKETGMGVETFVRGVMGFDSLKSGQGIDEAFERVMKFHFDYSDLSDFEQGVVKRLVPFYTWTRKNLPLMIEQIGANPKVFNRYNMVKKNIEGDEPRTSLVPPWMKRQGGIQLPYKYEGENMWILPDLPFKTPIEMLDPLLALDSTNPMDRVEAGISMLSTQLTPLIKGPLEWASNRNYWKGYDFTGKYVQVPTIYTKIPLLMPLLSATGKNAIAEKNENGIWMMRDKDLHVMAMMLPVFSDMRRLFPTEEKYQQRTLSTWMSWWGGLGLRTNTREEQERTLQAAVNTAREQRAKEYKRRAAGLKP